MAETDIIKLKLEIIQLIINCNDENVLLQCKQVLEEDL